MQRSNKDRRKPTGAQAASSGKATKQTGAQTSSQYRGVCWNKKNKRWQSSINVYSKYVYLGSFICEEDAARCYDRAAIKTKGMPCRLNCAASDYYDEDGKLLPDEHMDKVLADAQASAAQKVLDSLDDGTGPSSAQHSKKIGLAIAVLKQHIAQQDGGSSDSGTARSLPASDGEHSQVSAAGSRRCGAAACLDALQAPGATTGAGCLAGDDAAADEMELPDLQAFDSRSSVHQLWALQQQQQQEQEQQLLLLQQQQQQQGQQQSAHVFESGGDVYMSEMVQQLEARVAQQQPQQQQQTHMQQALLQQQQQQQVQMQPMLQAAQAEAAQANIRAVLQQCHQVEQPYQLPESMMRQLSVPSLQELIESETQETNRGMTPPLPPQQQQQQAVHHNDMHGLPAQLLQNDAGLHNVNNPAHAGMMSEALVPPRSATAIPAPPPAAAAAATAAAAASPPPASPAEPMSTAELFREAYQQALLKAGGGSAPSTSQGPAACQGGHFCCVDLLWLSDQLPERCSLSHLVSHTGGTFGVLYAQRCHALRSGLLWGAAVWDGNTMHYGQLYTTQADALRVCWFVLHVVARCKECDIVG